MSVIDLARYRARKDRARELALWRVFSGVYADLCEDGLIDFDAKTLRRLWTDYCADMQKAIRAREMLGPL
jgi:hypothetical protein